MVNRSVNHKNPYQNQDATDKYSDNRHSRSVIQRQPARIDDSENYPKLREVQEHKNNHKNPQPDTIVSQKNLKTRVFLHLKIFADKMSAKVYNEH